jgi:hypothetical protein
VAEIHAARYAQRMSSNAAASPQQAILAHLAGPLGTWVPAGPPSPGGWRAGAVRGGRGDVVDLDSVRLVKRLRLPGRCVVYATYTVVKSLHRLGPHDARAVLEAWPLPNGRLDRAQRVQRWRR